MRVNNDVFLLIWSVLLKEDFDSLEDYKDRKWLFEKVLCCLVCILILN